MMMKMAFPHVLLVHLMAVVGCSHALLETNNLCSVYSFVPFTLNGSSAPSSHNLAERDGKSNPGFAHMAAALMAMEHFNQRNTSVVPELDDFSDCPIYFDYTDSHFFDTGSRGHLASQSLQTAMATMGPPCAIAGPFNNIPALDLSSIATSAKLPHVMHRAYNSRIVSHTYAPFTSQVYPTTLQFAEMTVSFLRQRLGRTNYTTILYPISDLGMRYRETLVKELVDAKMAWHSEGYQTTAEFGLFPVETALLNARQRGFRTIILALEDASVVQTIADAAERLEMNNGDYFWVLFGFVEVTAFRSTNPNSTKLLFGSAWVAPIEEFLGYGLVSDEYQDYFYEALTTQGAEFEALVNAFNPISKGEPGYVYAEPGHFRDVNNIEYGQGFMYDAIMSIGIGACLAQEGRKNSTTQLSSEAHVAGIRAAKFNGATFTVQFKQNGTYPGARAAETQLWGGFNVLTAASSHDYEVDRARRQDVLHLIAAYLVDGADDQQWQDVGASPVFVYADGSQEAPPLRDPPDHHFLPSGLRVAGFSLYAIALVFSIATLIWVFVNRNHKVLLAAQPRFLYLLAVGSAIGASAIIPISFDESYGWTASQLSIACMTIPWLVAVGYAITFGALFAKLYRVDQVLQFSRRQMDPRRAVLPGVLLIALVLIVLGLWTGLDPFVWKRMVVDPTTGATIGHCDCNNEAAFAASLGMLLTMAMILTGVMAWRTRDVDGSYSESYWIFVLILLHVEVTLLAGPLMVLISDLTTTGRYIGYMALFWIYPVSTLGLTMLPKIIAFVRVNRGIEEQPKRGAHVGTRVTGISATEDNGSSTQHVPSSVDWLSGRERSK